MKTYNSTNPYPITVGKTVYMAVEVDATFDDVRACMEAAAAKLGFGVIAQINEYKNALELARLEVRPAGKQANAICCVTGLPDVCEVCTLEPVTDVLQEDYAGCFVMFCGETYHNCREAEADGSLHARDPVGKLDTFTTLAALQAFELAQECGASHLKFGFISKRLEFIDSERLLKAAQDGNDKFLGSL